jgi:Ca2+-binding EF-hand superfamily protein
MESIMTRATKYRALAMAALAAMSLLGTPLAQAQMRGNFDDADKNHDGRVTLQEFETYAAARLMAANGPRARRFKRLSPEQQATLLQQRFERMDRGEKGYLDRNDWSGP